MKIKKASERLAHGTSVHAIEDLYDANTKGKIFWGVLLAIAIAMVIYQLQNVAITFHNQEIGVTIREFTPASTPQISVCPDAWVSQKKAKKYNLTPTSVSIINGLFLVAGIKQLFTMEGQTIEDIVRKTVTAYGAEFLTKVLPLWQNEAQGSISALVDILGLEELNTDFGYVFPAGHKLMQEREITHAGVCFRFHNGTQVNRVESAYGGARLSFGFAEQVMAPGFLKTDGSGNVYELEPHFRVTLLGNSEHVDPGIMSDITFKYGGHYVLFWSVFKATRVSTRKAPCKNYSARDSSHCLLAYCNANYKGSGGGLDTYLRMLGLGTYVCEGINLQSDSFPEVKVQNPCNYFVDITGSSIMHAGPEVYEVCPLVYKIMAYQYTYHIKKDVINSNRSDSTLLEVKASHAMVGIHVEEYRILGVEEFLSNIGGTLGLWMGASVMSLVQIFYLLCLQHIMKKNFQET